MNSSSAYTPKPKPTVEQEMGKSTTDKFTQQLGQHGYLKHSNKVPVGYNPPTKYTQNDTVYEEDEPHKREVGKAAVEQKSVSQNRDMGARNINRRIVEENLLRNGSAERQINEGDRSFRHEPTSHNNSFEPRYDNSFENRMQNLNNNTSVDYQQYQQYYGDPGYNRQQDIDPRDQIEQNQTDDEDQQDRYPPHDFYNQRPDSRNEFTQTPEPPEEKLQKAGIMKHHQHPKSRDKSVQPHQSIKYEADPLSKSVHIDPKNTSSYGEDQQKFDPFRAREVLKDAGMLKFLF
jgi:hypothetical protein